MNRPHQNRPAIAIGAAMSWEIEAILYACSRCSIAVEASAPGEWRTNLNRTPLLIYHTGVGLKSARRATARVIEDTSVATIINIGCAGGLDHTLASGDLIAPTTIIEPPPKRTPWPTTVVARQAICEAIEAAEIEIGEGILASSRSALLSSVEKRRFGAETKARAVDMESAAIAAVAATMERAFVSLRAILDPVDTELPPPFPSKKANISMTTRIREFPKQQLRLHRARRYEKNAISALRRVHLALFSALIEGTIDANLLCLR